MLYEGRLSGYTGGYSPGSVPVAANAGMKCKEAENNMESVSIAIKQQRPAACFRNLNSTAFNHLFKCLLFSYFIINSFKMQYFLTFCCNL